MKFAIVICSIPGYVHSECFTEIAETLHYGLEKLGLDSCISDGNFIEDRQHIILGAHLLISYAKIPELPPGSILYNLEQLEDNKELWLSGYLSLMRRCTVWDYSHENSKYLRSLGINVENILPISYYPGLERIKHQTEKDIDVLFIGSINPRREAMIAVMRAMGLEVTTLFGYYGYQRNVFISRAKILLNVHLYEAKILEMVRISFYLANNCCVISERSASLNVDNEWSKGVAFGSYNELPLLAENLCNDNVKRRALARRGHTLIKQRKIEITLRDALIMLNKNST
jgi:hypothetical protein